jgi:hypothetical protein
MRRRRIYMSVTREFFQAWLQENVGTLPPEIEVSPAVLAEQFEQDADAAGFGQEIRDEEIGNIDDAIVAALGKARAEDEATRVGSSEEDKLLYDIEALEVEDPKSGR